MAYLRWSGAPSFAYSHADGGDGNDALLVAWHVRGGYLAATAGALARAGCEGQRVRLRDFMATAPGMDAAAMLDFEALAPAVDQFLFEVMTDRLSSNQFSTRHTMKRTRRQVIFAHEILCDRCGSQIPSEREGTQTPHRVASIGFATAKGSVFGDGKWIEVDLCEACLRDTLGSWVRITPFVSDEPPIAASGKTGDDLAPELANFVPNLHCGEYPSRELRNEEEATQTSINHAQPRVSRGAPLFGWVPVAELFNRLADGDTLEQILEDFPAISRTAACEALREAVLRFPPDAQFSPTLDVWTHAYPRGP